MGASSKQRIQAEAARIAAVWDSEGEAAAKRAFKQLCDEWKLVLWEATVLADAVYLARKKPCE